VAELVKFYFGANVELLGVPYNHESEAAFSYFRSEVKAFAKKMERVSGNEISEEALGKSVALFESIRSSIRELYERQSRPETPISWREVYETVQAGYYLDKEEYLTLLRELLDEIGESPNDARISASAPRLLLSGSVIPPGDRKILCIIEDAGARIVVDDLWSGFAPHFDTFVKLPDIDGRADAYLGRHPHASLPSLDIATDRRLPNIRSLINEYRADGVLFHTLRYCDCFTFKANETKQALRDYGIPFLEIHTEYAGSDFEAIRTRVEAFVESFSSRIQAASA
jgi:benzoyl-CoA reductase/2-hydroxyglutaryl-CoA dehydratase subunit BcrC/BadD/HgdB